MLSRILRTIRWAIVLVLLAAVMAMTAAWSIGWFIDFSDQPQKADMIVVLAGGYERPFYGAELFRQGWAPEIWISRPLRNPAELKAAALGVPIPAEEEINQAVLRRLGVPAARIHLYGDSVLSTANEALALRRAVDLHGKTILVVTSRYHARRSKWIFRHTLPEAEILACAAPDEASSRRWWSRRDLVCEALLEPIKMLYYLLGGRFLSPKV